MKVEWSPLAVDRLSEIALWISSDRPAAAERLVDSIFAATDRITKFGRPELREIILNGYRIIYRLDVKHVVILTVRQSLQLLDAEDLVGD